MKTTGALSVTEHFTGYGLPYVEIRGCEEFQPAHIFGCGQCFRWNLLPGSAGIYLGVAGGRVLAVSAAEEASGNVITLANTDRKDYEAFWKKYFDFGRDYTAIRRTLSGKDRFLKDAAAFGRGIRILCQEPFETLISFIISANNNIPRIKGCVERLAAAFGEKIEGSDAFYRYLQENTAGTASSFYAFPTPERLACVPAEEFGACCRAGYRCSYLEKTVHTYLQSPIDCAAVQSAPLSEARRMLQTYAGVGPKVADCVLLFAGLRTDVFPVDVWLRRVLENLYFQREISLREAESFVSAYFGELAGYAQQYLFYGMREQKII